MPSPATAGVLPARPRKPRDKAKVESCVLIVERYLLGRLRHRTFYGLAELNQAIREMLADHRLHLAGEAPQAVLQAVRDSTGKAA